MTVIYRITNIPSTNPSPIFQDNKFELNKLCLRSFVAAFKEVKPKMIFLADYCDNSYDQMIENIVPFQKEVIHSQAGINATMLTAYMTARNLVDDTILFQECDYFYLPNTGKKLEEAIRKLGLVSPYDHRNFYIDRSIHDPNAMIELVDEHHYRSTERNTMTFGIRSDVFKANFDTFYQYGYLDNQVWHDLYANLQPLFVPIPSFATHMVADYLSPGIDWKEQFETYL